MAHYITTAHWLWIHDNHDCRKVNACCFILLCFLMRRLERTLSWGKFFFVFSLSQTCETVTMRHSRWYELRKHTVGRWIHANKCAGMAKPLSQVWYWLKPGLVWSPRTHNHSRVTLRFRYWLKLPPPETFYFTDLIQQQNLIFFHRLPRDLPFHLRRALKMQMTMCLGFRRAHRMQHQAWWRNGISSNTAWYVALLLSVIKFPPTSRRHTTPSSVVQIPLGFLKCKQAASTFL